MTTQPVSQPLARRRPERLWGVDDVSEYLGVPIATLYRWRAFGYGPQGRKVGRYVRYRPEDVESWFNDLTNPAA